MKKNWKNSVVYIMILTLFFSLFSTTKSAQAKDFLDIKGEAAILIEATTGRILYEKNIEKALPIASMTKMMSEYLVHEAVEKGKVSWEQKITISEYAHKISQQRALSNVPLELAGQYTVKELYEAMVIYSANGATIALAEAIAGSEGNFVKMMNEKAKELGLTEYRFVNSTGLNNSDLDGNHPTGTEANAENMMSARDTAALAQILINKYPDVLTTSSIPKKIFQEGEKYPIQMENWNWMIPGLVFGYEGMDGLKTGSTPTAKYSFTGTAKRGDLRFISVVMQTESYDARFKETKKLLDYGFSTFELKEVAPKGYVDSKLKAVKMSKGKEKEIALKTKEPVYQVVKKGEETKYSYEYIPNKKKINEDGEVVAPITTKDTVGYLLPKLDSDNDLGYVSKFAEKGSYVPVTVKESVEKANFIVLTFRSIGDFFVNIGHAIVDGVKGLFD